jgi:hypothetical protein
VAKKTRSSGSNGWKGFIDRPLSRDEREQCIHWDAGELSLEELLASLCESGYKISLTYNEKTQSFIFSLTGQDGSGKNAGYTLTSHARTVGQAAHVGAFKHYVLLEEDWNTATYVDMDNDFG